MNAKARMLVVAALFALCAAPLHAAVIQVDPGSWPGEYRIAGGPVVTGAGSADLSPGTYTVGLRFVGDVTFSIDGSGNVTSLTPDSADGVGNTLVLKNTTVTVDPGAYTGGHRVLWFAFGSGVRTYPLVPGLTLTYQLNVQFAGDVFLQVDGVGSVVNLTPASATASGSTLTLQNATVDIDPGAFTGSYRGMVGMPFVTGPHSYVVVPGPTMPWAAAVQGSGDIFYRVDTPGTVVCLTPGSATASGSTLTFKNATVHVDPGAYPGLYAMLGSPLGLGPRTFTVVPGPTMPWFIGLQFVGDLHFRVDTPGTVVNLSPDSMDVTGGDTVVLRNRTIYVKPANLATPYNLVFYSLATGIRSFAVVPGPTLSWRIDTFSGAGSFQVLDPCEVDPETLTIASDTFEIACTPFGSCTDLDEDGYGSPGDPTCPAGGAADCDDLDASIHPGAAEICDGVDNDCSGSAGAGEIDADHDGYRVCAGDCNDAQASQHPGVVELPGNAVDENCDG
ncbi:MAG TPA: putative metal-binding motif-containing protein, partial [Candidatus Polarisedimenticolaceae bacterium]|nr:putative metal-binding motif-containing protein [Candidatus Polarisedimenticolaceae bacterium]